MSDSSYPQQAATNTSAGWQAIKLRDLGDSTFALASTDLGAWEKTHIAGAATTVVKNAGGIFGGIVVNKAIALSTITIYDNTAASGTVVAIISQPLALLGSQIYLPYKCKMDNGITVVTSAADDITVLYI